MAASTPPSERGGDGALVLALSTRWNAQRQTEGEALIEQILGLGFSAIELGYDLRLSLVPGVQRMVEAGAVRVVSVHNFCPIPLGLTQGSPEMFELASLDRRQRERAIVHTERSIRFAAELGATVVVAHAGNVKMRRFTPQLLGLLEENRRGSPAFDRAIVRLHAAREKRARKHLDGLRESLARLLPTLESARVRLALENLPSWEAIPSELEMEQLAREINSPWLAYWHDTGHAHIRLLLGAGNPARWLERLRPWLAGLHINDVQPPAMDHFMPPGGLVDFSMYKDVAHSGIPLVLEPAPGTPAEHILEAAAWLKQLWSK